MPEPSRTLPRVLVLVGAWLAVYVATIVGLAASSLAPGLSPTLEEHLWIVAWDAAAPGRSLMRPFLDGTDGAVRLLWAAGGAGVNALALSGLCFVILRRSR